ncbi:DNA integrity scanning protein DisA nucleotide-binding domain protein [Bacillus thuringiensis]|uniref:DNA integrity scanning protein DisA nucleotide-binding domain protein n=1 Tax=Bacillus thuringiensis TaxID=1428 RepID=UPI000BFC3FCB|nr:DNA integrity scanning protein DisA nucleotide-binding domain protein [Bacillus thuringiensis]PGT90045.1 hypothetical protein COD17_09860 [Bacillus thuringiensis]
MSVGVIINLVLFILLVSGILYHIYYLQGVKTWKKLTIGALLIFAVGSVYIQGLGVRMQTELVSMMLVIVFILRWGNLGKKVEYRPYIEENNLRLLVSVVSELARERVGATVVIETQYDLEEVIETGKQLDKVHMDRDILELLWKHEETNQGAMVIKNSRIVSVNSKLPLVTSSQLARAGAGTREYASLGAVETFEAVAIAVNGTVGKISMMGILDREMVIDLGLTLKDVDVANGITEEQIYERLQTFLAGTTKKTQTAQKTKKEKRERPTPLTKEERKAKQEMERQKRLQEREERKQKAKMKREGKVEEATHTDEPKSFWG